MNSESKGRILRDFLGGMVVSLLVFALATATPFSASLLLFLSPLPILYFYSRLGRIPGIAFVLLTLVVAGFTLEALGHREYIPLVCLLGYLGAVLAETLRKSVTIEKSLLIALLALMVPVLLVIAYPILRTGEAPWQQVEPYLVKSIQENVKAYSELGVPADQVNLIRENARRIAVFFINILPALGIISAALCIWLNLLAARRLFFSQRLSFPDFGDLAAWKAPEKLVWVVIACGGMLLVPIDEVYYLGLNLLLICLFVYLLQGLAIISFFFRKKNIPLFLRTLFYVLLIFQQILILLVVAVGLFDLWIDFRKFNKTMSGSEA